MTMALFRLPAAPVLWRILALGLLLSGMLPARAELALEFTTERVKQIPVAVVHSTRRKSWAHR